MLAHVALLLGTLAGGDDHQPDVSPWLHLEPGTWLVFDGRSGMDYQQKGASAFVEKFTFTATWWLADTDQAGRVRAMLAVRGVRNEGTDPELYSVTFFSIDPRTLATAEEPRAGTRFGTSGPSPPPAPFPIVSLAQLEDDHTWIEQLPLGGTATDHRVTVSHPERADQLDVANVVIELQGPLPISRQESFGPMHYDAWTNEYDVDLGTGHVLAHKRRFDVRFNDVTQKSFLELTLARWESLDQAVIAAEVAALRKVDELLGTDPDRALELARAFVAEHAQSPRRDLGEYFVERARVYARSIAADKEESAKLAAMVGKPAPDFTLEDLNGNRVSLSQLRGKIVLLSFWGVG